MKRIAENNKNLRFSRVAKNGKVVTSEIPFSGLLGLDRMVSLRRTSKSSLARAIGKTPSNISRYINGSETPKADILAKICDQLDCTLADLLTP